MRNQALLLAVLALTLILACTKKTSTPQRDLSIGKQNPLDFSEYALMGLDSPFISVDTANMMIGSYLNSISSSSNKIKSFIVDANALRYYLQNTNIKYVKLMLAHKKNYIRGGGQNQDAGYDGQALTMVITGFDSSNNYIYSPQGAVLDFSQPCPFNCPTSGSAAYDLLPVSQ